MLLICTTETPFKHVNGDLYIQIDGVSMGSCLGPTFAEFYMCHLENKVFDEHPSLKPNLYVRYVDDIFVVIENVDSIEQIKQAFESESVLSFTHEEEKDNQLSFLDCLITRFDEGFSTSVHIKETNNGNCLNYNSICPERYKIGVINSYLHRAYHVSSNNEIFETELTRIKQLLTNNNFPMCLIERTVSKFLATKTQTSTNEEKPETIDLYFRNQMTSQYKMDEKKLKQIMNTYVSPVAENKVVKLIVYYKTRRLSNLFIRNRSHYNDEFHLSHHVVYKYTCEKEGCNSLSYIGYTTCSLGERFKMHTSTGSICKHLREKHQAQRIPKTELLENTKILVRYPDKRRLIIAEALLIKTERPALNSQDEGSTRVLKIFIH